MNNYVEPLPKLNLDTKHRFHVKECPCGRNNRDGKFVPYVGHDDKGYCHSCGQTFLPVIEKSNGIVPKRKYVSKCSRTNEYPEPKQPQFIPTELFKDSLKQHEANNFVKYLIDLFDKEVATKLIEKNYIGTSKHWNGATIFWQIDSNGKIRTGKIMLYNKETGKRVKEPFNHVTWAHKALGIENYEQCLFGEHLIRNNNKPIAIVESEKTAIIASGYLPQFLWLACGAKTGLTENKCKVLHNRNVTLFPDLNAFDEWNAKAKEYGFKISDLLERKATDAERKQGLDIADYLVRYDYRDFNKNYPPSWDSWQASPINAENTPYLLQNKLINLLHKIEQEFLLSTSGNGLTIHEKQLINIIESNRCEPLAETLTILYAPKYYNSLTEKHNS